MKQSTGAVLVLAVLLFGGVMSTITTPVATFYATPGGTVTIPYCVYRDTAYSSTGDPVARDYYSIYIDALGDLKDYWGDTDIEVLYKLPIKMEETKYGSFDLVMPARAGTYEMYIEYSLHHWSDGRRYDAARIPIIVVCTDPANWPADYIPPREGPARGNLSITTVPAGAEVFLDGQYKGLSPVDLVDVPAGSHQVNVTKSWYSDQSLDVQVVDRAELDLQFDLATFLVDLQLDRPVVYLAESNTVLRAAGSVLENIFRGIIAFLESIGIL